MAKVLWFSQRELDQSQIDGLRKAYGDVLIITHVNKRISKAVEIKEYIDEADVICMAAPINILAQTLALAKGKPVLRDVSRRVKENDTIFFKHFGWKVVEKINIKEHDLLEA